MTDVKNSARRRDGVGGERGMEDVTTSEGLGVFW